MLSAHAGMDSSVSEGLLHPVCNAAQGMLFCRSTMLSMDDWSALFLTRRLFGMERSFLFCYGRKA